MSLGVNKTGMFLYWSADVAMLNQSARIKKVSLREELGDTKLGNSGGMT